MASTDSIADNTGFAQKNGATFPILADPDKTTSEAYGVLARLGYAKRWTFYIDPKGTITKIDKGVNPMTAGADLVTNLIALGAPRSGS
jgi:thioredoxin-dependent peroxiredoxin